MKITLDADVSDAPGAVCKIRNDTGREILVQTDFDAPGIASSFGWSKSRVQRCESIRDSDFWDVVRLPQGLCLHSHTDGRIDCPHCGVPSAFFILDAIDYINDHDGESVDDPGYFDGGDA